MISIIFAVVSLAIVVYFGDWLKDILSLNFVLVLILAHVGWMINNIRASAEEIVLREVVYG